MARFAVGHIVALNTASASSHLSGSKTSLIDC